MSKTNYSANNVLTEYDNIMFPRTATSSLNQTEVSVAEGIKYFTQKRFSNIDIATPVYILFENPIDSGVRIALQERRLKTDVGGLSSFEILWDYDVNTATKTLIPIFNENNDYRNSPLRTPKAQVSILNPVTVPSPDRGVWPITGLATVASNGIEREGDFISTSGVGAKTSGGISPDTGFRVYKPGTGFLTRVVSAVDDNLMLWGYSWIEIPDSFFKEAVIDG